MQSTKLGALFLALSFGIGLSCSVLFAAGPTPQTADEYARLGTAFLSEGRWEEAIQALTTAIGIDPRHADAHTNLGIGLLFQRKR